MILTPCVTTQRTLHDIVCNHVVDDFRFGRKRSTALGSQMCWIPKSHRIEG